MMLGLWLGTWIPRSIHLVLAHTAVIRWIPHSIRVQPAVRLQHTIQPGNPRYELRPVQQPELPPQPAVWHLPGIALPSVKPATLAVTIPSSPGGGTSGNSLWVDIPIPGSGGLPYTGLDVVLKHYDCQTIPDYSDSSGYQWIDGRVNREGRVVSVEIMRSNLNGAYQRSWTERTLLGWQFKPLELHGYRTGFRFVAVLWWHANIVWQHLPQYRRNQRWFQWCTQDGAKGPLYHARRPFPFSGQMGWVLYPLKGHLPLAIPVTWGYVSRFPTPGLAQAVNYFLGYIRQSGNPKR